MGRGTAHCCIHAYQAVKKSVGKQASHATLLLAGQIITSRSKTEANREVGRRAVLAFAHQYTPKEHSSVTFSVDDLSVLHKKTKKIVDRFERVRSSFPTCC